MTKEQFQKFIDANQGRLIHIICDNMEHFWINAQDNFVGWDDDSETGVCIRPAAHAGGISNNDTPWELVQFRYDDIQYMISYVNTDEVTDIVKQWQNMFDNNNSNLKSADEVIKAIRESSVCKIQSARGYQDLGAREKDFKGVDDDKIAAKLM